MAALNKNAPEVPRLIEWAFLSEDVRARDDGGYDIINLNDRFSLAHPFQLFLVIRTCVPRITGAGDHDEPGPYPLNGLFLLSYLIKTKTEKDIEPYANEFLVAPQVLPIPFGKTLHEPDNYTMDIFADGAPQWSLDFFLR